MLDAYFKKPQSKSELAQAHALLAPGCVNTGLLTDPAYVAALETSRTFLRQEIARHKPGNT